VDLSIELLELPTKMTEVGSSGYYPRRASPQLGVEVVGHAVGCQLANHHSWMVMPQRDTPLEGGPLQGACLADAYLLAAVGELAEETCPLGSAITRWRLARVVTWRLECQETHPSIVTLQGRQGSIRRRWAAVSLEEMRLLGRTR